MNRIEYNNIVTYHPGYYLKEMIEELGISQDELSKRLNSTPKFISDFINGKAKLTDDLALKLATMFGTSTGLWLNLNKTYIEKKIEIERLKLLEVECEYARIIDYSYFVKLNILPPKRKIEEKVTELQQYFRVATLGVLARKDFLVQYKSAIATVRDINIINANVWVQTAINRGMDITTKPFDEKKLRSYLKEIRSMTVQDPNQFGNRLKEILNECGVALVFMPHLKNCGVNGAVKWLSHDKVILAINDRNKYADFFWFALFHEIAHVFQQRKKLLIVSNHSNDDYEMSDLMDKLENEANQIAQNTLIDNEKYKYFIENASYIESDIIYYSKRIGIHPGILVGRLQRDNHIEYSEMNHLRNKYQIN
jgi:HTH-type transcriptional regulator/antitoxin HigA